MRGLLNLRRLRAFGRIKIDDRVPRTSNVTRFENASSPGQSAPHGLVTAKSAMHDESVLDWYFSFSGRIGRKQWWLRGLVLAGISIAFDFVVPFVFRFADNYYTDVETLIGLWDILHIAVLICTAIVVLSLSKRRLHDRGLSGWNVLFGLIPLFGWLWAFVVLGFLAGDKDANKYGAPVGVPPSPVVEDTGLRKDDLTELPRL